MRIKVLATASETIICTSENLVMKSFLTPVGKFLARVYEKDQCCVFTYTKSEVKCVTIRTDNLQKSDIKTVHKYSIRGLVMMCIANKEILIFDGDGQNHELLVLDENNDLKLITKIDRNFDNYSLVMYEKRQLVVVVLDDKTQQQFVLHTILPDFKVDRS